MSDRPRKSTRLTVSLEEQDYGALADLAVARRVAFMLIRQAVRQFIERAQSGENKGEEILHARTSKQD
jgi:predicted transcriptional regulator